MQFLEISGIRKQLSAAFTLGEIQFSQAKDKKISITGETGSGKSTLLKLIAGLLQPDNGEIIFAGKKVLGPDEQLLPGHPAIAYLSQDHQLRNNYRMEELLEYAGKIPVAQAEALYRLCRIDHLLKRKNDQLSGGEKQRVALCRLLVGAPSLLLLDEPFSNLDLIHKKILQQVIADMSGQLDITCMLSSHDPLDTLAWAEEIIVMRHGRIIQQASPVQIYTKPADEYVAGLFGSYTLLNSEQAAGFGIAVQPGKQLLLRPGMIRISPDGVHNARVAASFFRGSYHELLLEMGDLQLSSIAPGTDIRPGTPVSFTLDIADPWIL